MTIFRSAAPVQPLTLTVDQAATVLGVARSTAYELVRAGTESSPGWGIGGILGTPHHVRAR